MKLEDLKITCEENNWSVSCTPETDSDQILLRIRGRREGRGVIPECTVSFRVPHTGILYRWTPETNRIPSLLRSQFESGCVLYVPIVSLYGSRRTEPDDAFPLGPEMRNADSLRPPLRE